MKQRDLTVICLYGEAGRALPDIIRSSFASFLKQKLSGAPGPEGAACTGR